MLPTTSTLFLDLNVSDLRANGDDHARCAVRAVGSSLVQSVGYLTVEAAEMALEAAGYHHVAGPVWRS